MRDVMRAFSAFVLALAVVFLLASSLWFSFTQKLTSLEQMLLAIGSVILVMGAMGLESLGSLHEKLDELEWVEEEEE